jgi:MSHA biogenesis protein MshQ
MPMRPSHGMVWLRPLFALWLCGWAFAAHAATYTFRSDSFLWENAANTVVWDKTCTGFPGDDDKATINFSGGFTFTFGGSAYASVRVLANGVLQFGADTGFFREYNNTTLPAGTAAAQAGCTAGPTANAMMAYWTDLDPSRAGSGNVTWEQKGVAPNRYVVVSWNSVYQYNTNTPYAFQIVLFENGEFKYQYGNSNATGSAATIGVQLSSTDFTLYSYNSGYNANGSAIRWFIPSGAPARVAEYRLDEYAYNGTVGEATDSSGNAHNGTRVGAATTVAGGQVCRALDVPANTTAAAISAIDTQLDVDTGIGSAGTLSFWVRSNVVWTSNTPAMLIDATTSASRPFYLMRNAGGSLRFALADSAGTALVATTAAQSFAAATWVHVAATWRLAAGTGQTTLRLYVNGILAATTPGTSNGSLDPSLASIFVGDNRSAATPPTA